MEYAFGGQSPWGGNANGQVVPLTSGSLEQLERILGSAQGSQEPRNQPRDKAPWSARCSTRSEQTPSVDLQSHNPCASWFGPGVVAGACDPTALSRSLASGTLNTGTHPPFLERHERRLGPSGGDQPDYWHTTATHPVDHNRGRGEPKRTPDRGGRERRLQRVRLLRQPCSSSSSRTETEVAANAHGPVSIKIIPQERSFRHQSRSVQRNRH